MTLPRTVAFALAAALALSAAAQAQTLTEGQHLRAQGCYDEARKVLAAVLRHAEKLEADNRSVAIVLDNQGANEIEQGDFGEAERVLNRARAILNTVPADDSVAIAVKRQLAELYIAERRLSEAEHLLQQTVADLRASASTDRVALALTYNDLGVSSALEHKRPRAETFLRQGLDLLQAEYGSEHFLLASSLEPLAAVLSAEHRYAEAVAPAEWAWRLMQSTSTPVGAPDRASALGVLSEVYAHTGRIAEAETYAAEAAALAESLYQKNQPLLGTYLRCYAEVLKLANHKEQAREVKKRADAVLAEWEHNTSAGGHTVNVNALR